MPHSFLRRYRGAAVKLHINGKSASGVLSFAEDGSPLLSSLCVTQGHAEGPLFSHMLADHEIATFRHNGPRRLISAIALTHADGALHSAQHFMDGPAFASQQAESSRVANAELS